MKPPSRAREHILATGPFGGGKSTIWRKVWDHQHSESAALKIPGTMYVIDTDMAAWHICPDISEECVREVQDWPEYMEAIEHFRPLATRDDWLVIDRIDPAYKAAQKQYVQQTFGKDFADFFQQWKMDSSGEAKGNPLADGYGSNWQVINAMYDSFMLENVLRWPGHVIACAAAEPIKMPDKNGQNGDPQMIIDAFGRFGVKPAGQKMLGFQFTTVMKMTPKRDGTYTMTAMKQINRPPVLDVKVDDFVMDYLVQVAGWKLEAADETV